MVQVVFAVFPLVFSMASNADSLVLFDFARDLIQGKALALWNLPRAPYIFPDTVLATALISLGWYGSYSIITIACINYLLMIAVVHVVLKHSAPYQSIRIWQTSIVVSSALLLISLAFPFAMVNIYWQLFASGAHFLTALVVLCILMLLGRWQRAPSLGLWLSILSLSLLEALSDSMAALLLFAWIGQQVISRLFLSNARNRVGTLLRNSLDLLTVLFAMVVGTLLGALLPRQSLLESFFSLDKFITAAQLFTRWTIEAPSHLIFIVLVIMGTAIYPLLSLTPQPKSRSHSNSSNLNSNLNTSFDSTPKNSSVFILWFTSPVVLPSLALVVSTPLFYQELGSLRYLAFPALLLLICTSAMLIQLLQLVRRATSSVAALIVVLSIALVATLVYCDIQGGLIGKQQVTNGRDAVGLAVGADASGALACIAKAKESYPLSDGVATYWNARPIRFASKFEFYLAQINPWRPRAGYFLWGNNGADFVYRDAKTIPQQSINASAQNTQNTTNNIATRSYNFVLATHAEEQSRLWGSLPMQATNTLQCKNHTLFYFENPSVLWQYLFPLGLPVPAVEGLRTNLTTVQVPSSSMTPATSAASVTYWSDDLFTQVGVRSPGAISTNGQSGFLSYGPYLSLPAGRYRLQVLGHLSLSAKTAGDAFSNQTNLGVLDVSSQFGARIIASTPIQESANNIAQLDFELARDTHDVEFRVQVPKEVQGQVTGYRLERISTQQVH